MATEHANFVLRQYRHSEQKDLSVKSKFGLGARAITYDTNLEADAADALALKVMADNTDPLVFEMEIEDLLVFENFIGRPPQFALTLTERNIVNRRVKVIYAKMNLNTGKTTIEVRG